MKLRYSRIYLSGRNKAEDSTDYIVGYKVSNGMYIDIKSVGLCANSFTYYEVNGKQFNTLREAKNYLESNDWMEK